MARKRVSVIVESSSERNKKFHDNYTNADMTRAQFVKEIKNGGYQNYHVRTVNGVETPVSNPDPHKDNNLG